MAASKRKTRRTNRVYIVGAAFSAGLGFPLTPDLIRCGLNNQKKGHVLAHKTRSRPRRRSARIIVVNPDAAVRDRVEKILGVAPDFKMMSVATWMRSAARRS